MVLLRTKSYAFLIAQIFGLVTARFGFATIRPSESFIFVIVVFLATTTRRLVARPRFCRRSDYC